MKFIAVLVLAFIAVALAVPHHKEGHEGDTCDYKCAGQNKPICASNGSCVHNFKSDCHLEMYNCLKHPNKQFEQDEAMCSKKTSPQCEGDFEVPEL